MHVPMEMFAQRAGVKMLHVPFTGAGPAVVALLGGQVDALATGPSTVIQHVKAGKMRVLATWGDKRLASLPDVPTLKERATTRSSPSGPALFVPAGTPEPVIAKLREAARVAVADPRFVERAREGRDADPVPRPAGVPPLLGRRREEARARPCSAWASSRQSRRTAPDSAQKKGPVRSGAFKLYQSGGGD